MSTLLLVPLDDIVVFPNMNVTISADVGDEERVLLVPRHEGEYATVGTVAVSILARVKLSISRSRRCSRGSAKVIAVPPRPARPVRPMR